MSILIPPDTARALGPFFKGCESRSLFKDRFADPQAKDDKDYTPRKDWFDALIDRKPGIHANSNWLPAHAEKLRARLMSRLMVDLAGGVMDNANMRLDRHGLPLIPGSAVKGCARRMALQALHDWISAQQNKNSTERPATDDACAPCCGGFETPAHMLAAAARVFGWTAEDWERGRNRDPKTKTETTWKSDFAWACHGNTEILAAARLLLPGHEAFAGTIAFLQASPNTDPGLELDVVTPHHNIYYSAEPDRTKKAWEWEKWNEHRTSPDTEDPVPVYFPAVKPQGEMDHFTFPLVRLRPSTESNLTHAKRWLAYGLELFGLGAKTASGYGWFQVSEIAAERQQWEEQATLLREKAALAMAEAEQLTKDTTVAEDNAKLHEIQPDESLYPVFSDMKPDALRGLINKYQFEKKYWPAADSVEGRDSFQVALLLYLTVEDRSLYDQEKGKPKSKVLLALRKLSESYARPLPA